MAEIDEIAFPDGMPDATLNDNYLFMVHNPSIPNIPEKASILNLSNYIGKSFIPMSGTQYTNPITGNLYFAPGYGLYSSLTGSLISLSSSSDNAIYISCQTKNIGMSTYYGDINVYAGNGGKGDFNVITPNGKAFYNGDELATINNILGCIPLEGNALSNPVTGTIYFEKGTGVTDNDSSMSFTSAGLQLYTEGIISIANPNASIIVDTAGNISLSDGAGKGGFLFLKNYYPDTNRTQIGSSAWGIYINNDESGNDTVRIGSSDTNNPYISIGSPGIQGYIGWSGSLGWSRPDDPSDFGNISYGGQFSLTNSKDISLYSVSGKITYNNTEIAKTDLSTTDIPAATDASDIVNIIGLAADGSARKLTKTQLQTFLN